MTNGCGHARPLWRGNDVCCWGFLTVEVTFEGRGGPNSGWDGMGAREGFKRGIFGKQNLYSAILEWLSKLLKLRIEVLWGILYSKINFLEYLNRRSGCCGGANAENWKLASAPSRIWPASLTVSSNRIIIYYLRSFPNFFLCFFFFLHSVSTGGVEAISVWQKEGIG